MGDAEGNISSRGEMRGSGWPASGQGNQSVCLRGELGVFPGELLMGNGGPAQQS